MKHSRLAKATLLSIALTGVGSTLAQDQLRSQDMLQLREQIYANDYMTQRERDAYLERMRLARTEQERERIRQQHREQMDQRMRGIQQHRDGMPGKGMQGGPGRMGGQPILLPNRQGVGRN